MQKKISISVVVATAFVFTALLSTTSQAQEEEKFTNLKVLDSAITKAELLGKMRNFSTALGVRCNFCHQEVEAGGRRSLDFASDEKETKKTARTMIRMVSDINRSYLAKLQQGDHASPKVSCFTCHHGYQDPVVLGDEIEMALAAGGIDSAKAEYLRLKDQFYGQAVYDFSERSLTLAARDLAGSGKTDDALAILKLNQEQFPKSVEILETYALVYADAGMIPEAIAAAKQVLEIEPDNRHMKRMLEQLQKQ